LVACGDDLVEQMRGFRALDAFDAVKAELIDKCSAEHLSICTNPLRGSFGYCDVF
jgi:hypothetical protein